MTAFLVQGLLYGDEAKGATVDKLCREYPVDTIIRFNGGSQCGHNVITPEGVHHTFSQFGAGMLANPTVRTHLSQYVLVDPITMMNEARELEKKTPNVWERTTVHKDAVIITPWHKRLNRAREDARGCDRHGSCGMGIGVARELEIRCPNLVMRAGDTRSWYGNGFEYIRRRLRWTVDELRPELRELGAWNQTEEGMDAEIRTVADQLTQWPVEVVDDNPKADCMVFEGAQGVLLDEVYGDCPHTTWTNCTFGNAESILNKMDFQGHRIRIGCLRSYLTRHGAGPLPGEDAELLTRLPEPHNCPNPYQGAFRVAPLNDDLLYKALKVCDGVDGLAVSHLDYLPTLGCSREDYVSAVERYAPVCMAAFGPTADDRVIVQKMDIL